MHATTRRCSSSDRRHSWARTLATARDELRGELANLRAAAEWIVTGADEGSAREVLEALYGFFWVHSWFDGAETLERLARAAGFDPDDPERATTIALSAGTYWAATGCGLGYDPALEQLAARCLPVVRERNLDREVAGCLCTLGVMAVYRDVYPEGVTFLEEAAARARSQGDGVTESEALSWLGFARLLLDDLDGAHEAFEAEFVLGEQLGSPLLRAYATSKLGIHADAEERYGDALRLHTEANELFASVGDVGGTGYTLSRASMSAFGLGDYSEALRLGRAGYEAFSEVNHRWGTIAALCRIGFAALALGDLADARQCFREALERAHAAQAISLELLALSGIGALLAEEGERDRAAELLVFALGHDQLPGAYGFAARPALDRLEAELEPDSLASARAAAAAAELTTLVAEALAA